MFLHVYFTTRKKRESTMWCGATTKWQFSEQDKKEKRNETMKEILSGNPWEINPWSKCTLKRRWWNSYFETGDAMREKSRGRKSVFIMLRVVFLVRVVIKDMKNMKNIFVNFWHVVYSTEQEQEKNRKNKVKNWELWMSRYGNNNFNWKTLARLCSLFVKITNILFSLFIELI